MRKIPSIFERDWAGDRSRVVPVLVAGCEWILAGEGTPTRKWDGTAVLVRSGQLYKRYDAKPGRTPPADFEPCEFERDKVTGHWPGWILLGNGPEDRWLREAYEASGGSTLTDGTYEAIGPKIGGNGERVDTHRLMRHGADVQTIGYMPPKSVEDLYANLASYLSLAHIEGIVWWQDGIPAGKIKRRDFGRPWPLPESDP